MRVRTQTFLGFLLISVCVALSARAQWEGAEIERLTYNTWSSRVAKQSLGIDKCDRLYLCYTEGGVLFTSKRKYGGWSPPEELSFGDDKRYSYAMAVNAADGTAHVALIRFFSNVLPDLGELYYGDNTQGPWQFTRIDSCAYGGYLGRSPAIAVDSLGNVHLLWIATYYDTALSAYFSQMVYCTDASGAWVEQVIYSSPGKFNGINAWIETEKDGVAHIMWSRGSVFHMTNDTLGGATWTADTLSQFPVIYWEFSDFRVDASADLHMLIEGVDYWGGPRYLYYYNRPAGSDYWGNPELVSNMGCIGRIAFDSQGGVHLVWTEADGNFCGWSVYYSYRDQQGWSSREIVGENYDYEYLIKELWTAFVLDSDQEGHLIFAGIEGLPVCYDSVEVFYYAACERYDIGHVIFLLNYLYKQGPAPQCRGDYDFNQDEEVTLADVILLLNYLFRGGPLFGS